MDDPDVDTVYPGFRAAYDPDRPHQMLAAAARRLHFEYVSLRPVFRAAVAAGATPQELFMRCDAHLTSRGHALVADTLFTRLSGVPADRAAAQVGR